MRSDRPDHFLGDLHCDRILDPVYTSHFMRQGRSDSYLISKKLHVNASKKHSRLIEIKLLARDSFLPDFEKL